MLNLPKKNVTVFVPFSGKAHFVNGKLQRKDKLQSIRNTIDNAMLYVILLTILFSIVGYMMPIVNLFVGSLLSIFA